ncbi:MAG: hypothetical protein HRU31_08095 [Rhodobacteraceae bacterium]|nr:hypothetical protein [Paracoccaceae bacterium]
MSRLDSFLRRMGAQRDSLNWVAPRLEGLEGDVIEMGLGNGRTYDHLRELFPDRRIWVIDRALNCHPSCVPPEELFLQGEAEHMLDDLHARGVRAALIHYDFGSGTDMVDQAESRRLSPHLAQVVVPGGYVVSGQPMAGMTQMKGPDHVDPARYMIYQL